LTSCLLPLPSCAFDLGTNVAAGDGIGQHGDAVASKSDRSMTGLHPHRVAGLVVDLDHGAAFDAVAREVAHVIGCRCRFAMGEKGALATAGSLHHHAVKPSRTVRQGRQHDPVSAPYVFGTE